VVWLCPIQFGGEPTLVECPLDLCTSKQKHPCTPLTTPSIATPFVVANLNLPSFEVQLESLDSYLFIVLLLWLMSILLFATLKPWP